MLTALEGQLYAQAQSTADAHLLRIYDAGICTGRFSHAHPIHCLQWLQLERSSDKRQKKRTRTDDTKAASPAKLDALAIGTQDGSLVFLDTKGHALKTLPAKSPVYALCTSEQSLWTAASDGSISVWSLPLADGSGGSLLGTFKGSSEKWSALLVLPLPADLDDKSTDSSEDEEMTDAKAPASKVLIIAASNTLTLFAASVPASAHVNDPLHFDIKASTKIGHTSAITSLHHFSSSPLRFTTSSRHDRYLNLWGLDPDLTLKAQLALEDRIAHSSSFGETLAAITETGNLALTKYVPSVASKKKKVQPLTPNCLIKGDVVDVDLQGSTWKVVRGTAKPIFQQVTPQLDGNETQVVELEAISAKALVQADEDVDMGAPSQRLKTNSKKDATVSAAAPVTSLEKEDAAMEPLNAGDLDFDANEPTLADRLKALQVQQPSASASGTDLVPVPTNSLTSALIQALHSNDTKLLESCLIHSKSPIVNATVKRLPTHLVIPLVDALVERLGRGRRGYGAGEASAHATRARALTAWLKCVLVVHIAHLISVPGLVDRLSGLYKTIQARLELQEPLLALAGRLELVVSQIELRREAQMVKEATREEVVDWVEGEDDESDEEDQQGEVEDVVVRPISEVSSEGSDAEDGESDGEEGDRTAVSAFMDLEAEDSGSEDGDVDYEALAQESASEESSEDES